MKSKGVVLGEGFSNKIGPNGAASGSTSNNGMNPLSTPTDMQGTVNVQFQGDQSHKVNPKSGTPNPSVQSNADQYSRMVSAGIPKVISGQGIDMNDARMNGNGVLFDGVKESRGLRPGKDAPLLDSPVPSSAQRPVLDAPEVLSNLRSGVGKAWTADSGPGDNFQTMSGVMSRDINEN